MAGDAAQSDTDRCGMTVAGGLDLDEDGVPDVGISCAGDVYLFSGGITGDLDARITGSTGDALGDCVGASLAAAGDTNGDGVDDVLVGGSRWSDGTTTTGAVWPVYGGI